MDPFEDDHIVANPARVMVVQLRKGEKPPFVKRPASGSRRPSRHRSGQGQGRRRRRTTPPASASTRRASPSRVYALPVEPGNLFHLLAGKGYVAWSSVPLFTEDEYEEFYRPGGATKWTFHVFSMKDQKEIALEDKIAEAQVSVNGDELVLRKEKAIYATSVAKAYESKKLGDRGRPVGARLPRGAARGVAADLRRRLALVPRLLLRQGHARPRLEGDPRPATRPTSRRSARASSSTGCCPRWSAS